MGNAPSQPHVANGEVRIVGNTNACGGGARLLAPVGTDQFNAVAASMPCTQQEYLAILQVAAPLGEAVACQSALSKPSLGDQICAQLNAQIPSCAFSMNTVWVKECGGEYWEYSLTFRSRGGQMMMGVPQPQTMAGAPPPQQTMMVTVLADSRPGTVLQMQAPDGQPMQVTVPEGVAPGESFPVGLPPAVAAAAAPAPPAPAPGTTLHSIVVPPGTAPGETLQYTGPNGHTMQVVVPPGVLPGQSFEFSAPASQP
eukprot:COSAG06_NODE_4777_length_3961_cov_8.311823_3_plen_255_part_00